MKKLFLLGIAIIAGMQVWSQELSLKDIDQMSARLQDKQERIAITNAISNNSIKKLAENLENKGKVNYFINTKVKSKGISNQQKSGRCWMFTGLNVMRAKVIEKYELDEF
ncbi:MAG: aminopeptidase, partial [Bacteroidales bacterium]|nr:aminopeptidase [Bacteroidales bacterium]